MNDQHDVAKLRPNDPDVARRDFLARGVAAGLTAAAPPAFSAAAQVVEAPVSIATPDGTCDAVLLHPASGTFPGVIVWPDAFGLRPAMRDIGRRLAADGYTVLVPNPFYRIAKAPVYEDASNVDFSDPVTMTKLRPLMASVGAPG